MEIAEAVRRTSIDENNAVHRSTRTVLPSRGTYLLTLMT